MAMMRAALALLLLAPTAASAALSGYYDSAERITAILTSEAVAERVGPYPIIAVENTVISADGQGDEWAIRTQDCTLTVRLVPQPLEEGIVGKTTYVVEPLGTCR